MISIKDMTNEELEQQIIYATEELDTAEYGTGDYNSALSELKVAEKEKQHRQNIRKKLLSERKNEADKGNIQMCQAEYSGSWLPYKQNFEEVTLDWLLEELTYDDCNRKEEIVKYLSSKIKNMESEIHEYHEMKEHLKSLICSTNISN